MDEFGSADSDVSRAKTDRSVRTIWMGMSPAAEFGARARSAWLVWSSTLTILG